MKFRHESFPRFNQNRKHPKTVERRPISGIGNLARQRFRKFPSHVDSFSQPDGVERPQPVCQQRQKWEGALLVDFLQPIFLIQSPHPTDQLFKIRSPKRASAVQQTEQRRQSKQFEDHMRQKRAGKFLPRLSRMRPLDDAHLPPKLRIPYSQQSPSQ